MRDYYEKKMTNEMTGRVFLDANPYWAGSNEVQIMLRVAKHGSFIFFPELGLATWFCKGSVTIINFDHCELIGISSSFCRASNCTCQLPRDKFCQTYSSDPDRKFFSQFSKPFLLLPYLVWSRNFLILIKYCNVRRKNHYHAIKR